MSSQVFEVSNDSFLTSGTLEDFRKCLWGEEDLYSIKDGNLYYGNKLIGIPLEEEVEIICSTIQNKIVYFYPDFRERGKHKNDKDHLGSRVIIYEKSEDYTSGFVMIGALGLKTAEELHPNWLWLLPEEYIETEKNFK